jgi:hypothetical protein
LTQTITPGTGFAFRPFKKSLKFLKVDMSKSLLRNLQPPGRTMCYLMKFAEFTFVSKLILC